MYLSASEVTEMSLLFILMQADNRGCGCRAALEVLVSISILRGLYGYTLCALPQKLLLMQQAASIASLYLHT